MLRVKGHYLILTGVYLLGVLANIGREFYLVTEVGINTELDFFRAIIALPTFYVQTIGTVIVTALVSIRSGGYRASDKILFQALFLISILICVFGLVTSNIQSTFLYPGLSNKVSDFQFYIKAGWLLVIIGAFGIFFRYKAVVSEVNLAIASATIVRAVTFVFVVSFIFQDRPLGVSNLVIATAISFLIIPIYLNWRIRGSYNSKMTGQRSLISPEQTIKQNPDRENFMRSIVMKSIAIAIPLQVLHSFPRIIDRRYATLLEPGTLGIIELTFGVLTALAGAVISTVILVTISNPEKVRLLLEKLSAFKVVFVIILTAIPYTYLTFYMMEKILALTASLFLVDENLNNVISLYSSSIPFMLINGVFFHWLIIVNKVKILMFGLIFKISIKAISIIYLFSLSNPSALSISHAISEVLFFLFVALTINKSVVRGRI